MPNIAGRILDLLDDSDGDLVKQAAYEGVLPDWVRTAHAPTSAHVIPDSLYAYVDSDVEGRPIRKYALDSRAATWLSGAYFLKHAHVLPARVQQTVAHKIKLASLAYQVDVPNLLVKVASGETVLEPERVSGLGPVTPEKFAFYRQHEDGRVEARFPIFNGEHVKLACDYFVDNHRFMEPSLRREMAQKIVERAGTLVKEASIKDSFEIPDLVARYAGEAVSEMLPFGFKARMERLEPNSEKYAAFDLLWENRGSFTLTKMAQALENLDRNCGFDRLWDSKIPDPWVTVATFEKTSMDESIYADNGMSVTGTMVRKLAMNPDALSTQYEKDFVDQFCRDPVNSFLALPSPDKQKIAELAVRGAQNTEAHTYGGTLSAGKAL